MQIYIFYLYIKKNNIFFFNSLKIHNFAESVIK